MMTWVMRGEVPKRGSCWHISNAVIESLTLSTQVNVCGRKYLGAE
jgi:hypothetical protein